MNVCVSWDSHHVCIYTHWFCSILWRYPLAYIVTSFMQWMFFWHLLYGLPSWFCLDFLAVLVKYLKEWSFWCDFACFIMGPYFWQTLLMSETENITSSGWWMCVLLSHKLALLDKIHHIEEPRTFQMIHEFYNYMILFVNRDSSFITLLGSLK